MNKFKIYLSGNVKNIEEDFQSWRTHCKTLTNNGYYAKLDFIDPISFFNYTNKQAKTDKQCLDLFMWLVEQSDVLLINLEHSDNSCGSCMEVEHAYCRNVPIIGFGSKNDTHYNWATERCTIVFNTLDEAIDYIYSTYVKVVS